MAVKNILKYLRSTKDLFFGLMEKEIYKLAGIRIPVLSPIRTIVNLNQVLYIYHCEWMSICLEEFQTRYYLS